MADAYRKKLIEVALPLAEINAASAREKSIRHGHPSTLHLWWARRPLAACRAVLFGQLVDDPSAVPEEFPTAADQARERERLFAIIKQLVLWENSNNQTVLDAAKREIARSVARAKGLPAPTEPAAVRQFLLNHAPPVLDPFCGGGSIPLEAQRLGLRTYASDLNPVAVLITKALIEIPPKFAGQPPVNPEDRARIGSSVAWPGASGLAADVRYYGRWMRDEAQRRIGHLYPKVQLPGGGAATVIAWLWARTVRCPNPACGAQMPLVRSFALSTKPGKLAWVEPQVDPATKTVRFAVRTVSGKAPGGTVNRRGARCIVCDTPVPFDWVRAEGRAGRMHQQMMAIVAEGQRGRVYLPPTVEHEAIARQAQPEWAPDGPLAYNPRYLTPPNYGMRSFAELFTRRQLTALTTLCDLVGEARARMLGDAEGPEGAHERADAVATYLACTVDRGAESWCSLARWQSTGDFVAGAFSRQALSVVWDFAEANPFSSSTRNYFDGVKWVAEVLLALCGMASGFVGQHDSTVGRHEPFQFLISTDPPYYDNIGYADLSDFFYVWLRHSLKDFFGDLFQTVLVPKSDELIANPYRFDGSKDDARNFFEERLHLAFSRICTQQASGFPISIYYAFKQAESADDNDDGTTQGEALVTSTGWEAMLQSLVDSQLTVEGTWPMRTERGGRLRDTGFNALASSIVLVCRPRPADAPVATRRQFIAALKQELPEALRTLQQGNIAPVDLQQAAIGPGMAIFSRYRQVVDPSGKPLSVRAALGLINQALDEVLSEQEGDFDGDTRWAIVWFEQHGMGEGDFGSAETLSKAKDTSVAALQAAGVVQSRAGKVCLLRREELPAAGQQRSTWAVTQQLIKALQEGGEGQAAALLTRIGPAAAAARDLAYRLYVTCERKGGLQEEAGAYNGLVVAWPEVARLAGQLATSLHQEALA